MKILVTLKLLLWGIILAPLAAGETRTLSAQDALIFGYYDEAVMRGQQDGTADGLTIAASALVAKILTLQSEDIKDDAKDARDLAEKALALDPDNAEARLQYAVAYGIVTRASSNFTVWRKNMPQKSMAAILAAQSASPEDARVDALLGSWHLGIVRKAGAERGADMFGADEAAGIAAFEQAALRAPGDIVIHMNYALSALALDPVKYADTGEQLLRVIGAAPVTYDIDRVYQSWAQDLLAIYEDKAVLQEKAEYFLDGE